MASEGYDVIIGTAPALGITGVWTFSTRTEGSIECPLNKII